MRYKYLLWDFDGTLFDTYPPLIRSIEGALADSQISAPRDVIATLLDDTLSTCIAALVEKHQLDAASFEERIYSYWGQTTPQDNPPFPGAINICQRVLAAGGRNYIVTHRGRASLLALLDWYEVTRLFDDCLTRDDGYPRKPDPASFQAMIAKHNLPREDVLAIGDRKLDILAGQAAGIHTCLFGTQPPPNVAPDYVIVTFDELATLLGMD